MDGFAAFRARYIDSAAYHEAGHMTAAADQGMPLSSHGIHIDPQGNGISYYWHREPGDPTNSPRDQEERERTIVALYAGRIAQQKFFPDAPQEAWEADDGKIEALLDEMCTADRSAIAARLLEQARGLVERRWHVIEALAGALLAKPLSPQSERETHKNWSRGQSSVEKRMSASEVAEFFNNFRIQTSIVPDSVGNYDPWLRQ